MDDALETNDSEEPGAEPSQPSQEQDGERQQGLPPGRLRQAAGQPASSSCAVASLRHRRAAAPVPRVRHPGVQRGFVFFRNRVMLRHILRQSCRGKQAKRAISSRTGKNPPFLPFLCHAPLPNPLAPPSLRAPDPPKSPAVSPNFLTLLPTDRETSSIIPGSYIAARFCSTLEMTHTRGSSSSSFLPWSWMKVGGSSAWNRKRCQPLTTRQVPLRRTRFQKKPNPRPSAFDRRPKRPMTKEQPDR